MTIKLLHMYYDIMNLYGEYGNIKILEKHIKDQGYDVEVDRKTIGDEINIEDYDFIYVGCGTEKNQKVVLEDLVKYKENLKKYIDSEKYILFTGNSFELLGKKINNIEGLGILDFEVANTKNRITSDIIYSSKYFKNKIVGFVNKMSNVIHNTSPLFKVEFGIGENGSKDYEGIKYKNLYGTYVIGPLLVKNPEVLKCFVDGVCEHKDRSYKSKIISYENEKLGYELTLSELEKRK